VDAGTVLCGGRLGAQVEALESALKAEAAEDSAAADATSDAAPPRLGLHVLTHAHPDHNGASQLMCTRFGVPFWVGEADADVAEGKVRSPGLLRPSRSSAALHRPVSTATPTAHPLRAPHPRGIVTGVPRRKG
jgi:glyoxylase-like metal-dependent hydrolase (beta-lactamase superfamily II)